MLRTEIAQAKIRELHYEIREIVDFGRVLQRHGISMTWENIGDPIAAGEKVAPWIKEIVREIQLQDASWGYCPSRGVLKTREYLADAATQRPNGVPLGPDDILFFNGIADAIATIYKLIQKDNRVLIPSPSYPTHALNEGKRSDYGYLQFQLDPKNDWQPDLVEVENMVKYNPQVTAIAIVNPDNPTGTVYTRETLDGIVSIARRYGLFIICDEIYVNICYNGAETLHLSQVVGDVPALALRGVSKDVPWPGSRCGWVEMINRTSSPFFQNYCNALVKSKMIDVCSTTLPQLAIPAIYGDPRYEALKKERARMFEHRSNQVYDYFCKHVPGMIVRRTQGAFYFCAVFEHGVLNDRQTLPIKDADVRAYVEASVKDVALDKRFVHYLMASAGVCVTPLSGFHTDIPGFRLTTLAPDDVARAQVLARIGDAIKRYVD